MAAVLAGLTNLSLVSILSQRHDLPKKQDKREIVSIDPFRILKQEKESPPLESPPLLKPKLTREYHKPNQNNINRILPDLTIEMPDIKPLKQDLKLSAISINTDNCPCGSKQSHAHMNFSKHCFDMDEVDVIPQTVSAIQPFYPYRAKRLSTVGYVTIRFLVDTNGDVSKLSIVESSPNGIFDQSVRDTVPKWKFRPGRKDGKPVRTWLRKTIEFTLDSSS